MSEKYLITITTGKNVKIEKVNTAFSDAAKGLDENTEIEFKISVDESLNDDAIQVTKTLI